MSYKESTSDIFCDLCRKKIVKWNPFNRGMKRVVAIKDHIWTEYYHFNCLVKAGVITKKKKEKAGRWDKDDDDDKGTSNLVH